MKLHKIICLLSILLLPGLLHAQQRIVSLNGTISEMLCALGLEDQIAGVDVTSIYPASLEKKPKTGHNRTVSAEGVLALRPTLVIGLQNEVKPEIAEQLKAAGVKMQLLKQEHTAEGTRSLLQQIAAVTNTTDKAKTLLADFNKRLAAVQTSNLNKKVLFVYARGTKTMSVCGSGTAMDKMMVLCGTTNAMAELENFKPLSAESLVAANPDVIILFDTGLQSVGGIDGMLKIPGVEMTNAGKNRKIIAMNGHLFAGFGLQLPEAIQEYRKKVSG